MSTFSSIAAALAAAALVGAAGQAQAGSITAFSNLSAWTSAVSGTVVVEDFNDATLQAGFSLSQGGAVGGNVYTATAISQANDARNPKWNFGSSNAFSADFDLNPGGPGDSLVLAIDFVDGSASTIATILNPLPNAFVGFFGVVADRAIKSVRFDSPVTGVEEFSADNLRFIGTGGGGGGGGELPEPASLALAGLGLGAAFAARRRPPVAKA